MTRLWAERQPGMASARVISFNEIWTYDEMWTYVGARRGEKRRRSGFGRRWWWRLTGCAGADSRWETAARRPSPGCLCNCQRPGDTAALITWYTAFCPATGAWWARGRSELERGNPVATEGPAAAAGEENQRVQQERGDIAGFHRLGVSEAGLNLIASAC